MEKKTRIRRSLLHLIFPAAIVASLLAGCNLPGQAAPTATFVFPTLTQAPTLGLPTPTSIPPSPTASAPTATPRPAPIRIDFAAGATAGVKQGTLQAGEIREFVLNALQTQPMIVNLDSPGHDLVLGITGQGSGNVLLDAGKKWNSWEGILPSTQDYLIAVSGGASAEAFTLTVDIPSRIKFNPGATSAQVSGSTPGGLIVSYVIYALANQNMSVDLNVPADRAALTIYGFEDGQPYLRSMMNTTSWSGTLTVAEDYILQIVPNSGQVVNYSMTVTVK